MYLSNRIPQKSCKEMIGKMTPEQLADLKEAIAKMETPEKQTEEDKGETE